MILLHGLTYATEYKRHGKDKVGWQIALPKAASCYARY